MLGKKQITAILIAGLVVFTSSQVFAAKKASYKEGAVSNGGTVTGSVSFKGDVPAPVMQDLNKEKNPEFCSKHPDAKDGVRPIYRISVKDGKLLNAVVLIENISEGKAWSKETIAFEFKDCDIFPLVNVVRKTPKGQKTDLVQITNEDEDILHNPHGYNVRGAQRVTLFNKPLPSQGSVADVTKNLKRLKAGKDRHFFLQCDQHNFMEADARIVWNPYYAITNSDGSFQLDQVPAGKYKVTAWHPYAGQVTQEVTVSAGTDATANFEITSGTSK